MPDSVRRCAIPYVVRLVLVFSRAVRERGAVVVWVEQVLTGVDHYVEAHDTANGGNGDADGLLPHRNLCPEHLHVEDQRQDQTAHGDGSGASEVHQVEEVVLQQDRGHRQDRDQGDTHQDVTNHVHTALVLGEVFLALGGRQTLFVGVALEVRDSRRRRRRSQVRHLLLDLDLTLLAVDSERLNLVHAEHETLGHVESRVQDRREGNRQVQLHEQVRHDHRATVRGEAQRRGAVRVRGVHDREEEVPGELASTGDVADNGDGQEEGRGEAEADDDDARHALGLRVLALEVGDHDGSSIGEREVAESAMMVPRQPATAMLALSFSVGISATGMTSTAMKMIQTVLAERVGEQHVQQRAAQDEERARGEQAHAHVGDHHEETAPLAGNPFAEVAIRLHRSRGHHQHLGQKHRGVDVGEGHEQQGDGGVAPAGASVVGWHAEAERVAEEEGAAMVAVDAWTAKWTMSSAGAAPAGCAGALTGERAQQPAAFSLTGESDRAMHQQTVDFRNAAVKPAAVADSARGAAALGTAEVASGQSFVDMAKWRAHHFGARHIGPISQSSDGLVAEKLSPNVYGPDLFIKDRSHNRWAP
ncbi:hypothetical protein ON010_g16289 [Phytophthora cinnamomi]|nr:hypothetical protein ON010_g16289 [Phytophthora cinnamomi]